MEGHRDRDLHIPVLQSDSRPRFKGLGFRVLGFRGLAFRGLGFRVSCLFHVAKSRGILETLDLEVSLGLGFFGLDFCAPRIPMQHRVERLTLATEPVCYYGGRNDREYYSWFIVEAIILMPLR